MRFKNNLNKNNKNTNPDLRIRKKIFLYLTFSFFLENKHKIKLLGSKDLGFMYLES